MLYEFKIFYKLKFLSIRKRHHHCPFNSRIMSTTTTHSKSMKRLVQPPANYSEHRHINLITRIKPLTIQIIIIIAILSQTATITTTFTQYTTARIKPLLLILLRLLTIHIMHKTCHQACIHRMDTIRGYISLRCHRRHHRRLKWELTTCIRRLIHIIRAFIHFMRHHLRLHL